jgi:hypothetical protein
LVSRGNQRAFACRPARPPPPPVPPSTGLACVGLAGAGTASAAPAQFNILIGDVNSGKIFLIDRSKPFTDANIKWSLNPAGSGHPMEHRFRDTNGDGRILPAVTGTATSGMASLHVFRPTNSHSSSLVKSGSPIPFHQAHGLLWDPQLERMRVAGSKRLTAYRTVTTGSSATLVEDTARRLDPFTRAHDLKPDHQNPGRLLVTDTYGVYAVDKATLRESAPLHSRRLVKSYVHHSSGEQMRTGAVADGNAFGTKYVHFKVSGVARARAGAIVYKARLDTPNYL